MNLFIMNALAEPAATGAAGAAGAAAGPAAMLSSLMLPILMLVVLYFIMIRPQRKKDKLTKEMLAGLLVGDKIVTIGGIHGKITAIKDEDLVIKTGAGADESYIKISRWAVREVVKPAEA